MPSVLSEISEIGSLVGEIVSLVHTIGNPASRLRAIRDGLRTEAIAASDALFRAELAEQSQKR